MFIPVGIRVGAGGGEKAGYSRIIETAARFDALGAQVQDMTVPFTHVGQDLHTHIAAQFATQGDLGAAGRWRPLSPAYAAWKEKRRPGTPILVGLRPAHKGSRQHPQRGQTYVVSGVMRRQLLVPLQDRTAWHIGPQRLVYMPLSDIAGYHELGTSRMPARPPVDLTLEFLHSVDRTFTRWLAGLMEKSGL